MTVAADLWSIKSYFQIIICVAVLAVTVLRFTKCEDISGEVVTLRGVATTGHKKHLGKVAKFQPGLC